MMLRTLKIIQRCTSFKPSLGFQSLHNLQLRQQIQQQSNPKLDALIQVILSLSNKQNEYLNLILTQQSLKDNHSILRNKIINKDGYKVQPFSYLYQQEWIKDQWKDTELLQFIMSDDIEEAGTAIQVQVVKEHYDVELTSLDVAQKIKIIKSLRQIFSLGLKEAKDFADKVPSMLKKNMKRQQAQKLKKDLEATGCVITLK